MTTRSSRLFRVITNPAVTIVFAVIGVAVGILAIISPEGETRKPNNGSYGSCDMELQDIRAQQGRLRKDIDALKEKNEALAKLVAELDAALQRIEVRGGDHMPTTKSCEPAWLIVRSDVEGDTIYIDDVAKGPTGENPIQTCAGLRRIRVTKPGFNPIYRTVDLEANDKRTVKVKFRPK